MDLPSEIFENNIEVDFEQGNTIGECDFGLDNLTDKENNRVPVSKTRQVQIEKIIEFVKGHNEQLIGKRAYDSLWDVLTKDLNELGPPTNTTKKWRQIWSSYKYNNKKRLPVLLASACQNSGSQDNAEPSNQVPQSLTCQMARVETKLSQVLVQQDEIIKKLQKHTASIERLNMLLEEISKKLN